MDELRILLACHDGGTRDRLSGLLADRQYSVEGTPHLDELLEALHERACDAALVTDDIPDVSVSECLRRVHGVSPEIPVVILATKPTVPDAVEAIKAGAHHYLEATADAGEIRAAVASALGTRGDFLTEAEHAKEHRLVSLDDFGSIDAVDDVMRRHSFQQSKLIAILQDIQRDLRYLTRDTLRHVAERLNVPLPRVYGVATFYKAFSLKPRGRHTISVCLGTACHVKGGVGILEKLERELGIRAGEMTFDERFSLELVRCVGCCGLAPVVVADEDFHGRITQDRIPLILKDYE